MHEPVTIFNVKKAEIVKDKIQICIERRLTLQRVGWSVTVILDQEQRGKMQISIINQSKTNMNTAVVH